jgi:hypothetical protein
MTLRESSNDDDYNHTINRNSGSGDLFRRTPGSIKWAAGSMVLALGAVGCAGALSAHSGHYDRLVSTHAALRPTSSATSTGPAPSNPPSPASGVTPGAYVDESTNKPHYVLTVAGGPSTVSGWLYFVYQDGRTSLVFHYHGTLTSGTLTLNTVASASPFPYNGAGHPPFPQAGSQPISAGQQYTASYSRNEFVLSNCGSYLYWANKADYTPSLSCTFTYQGAASNG